MDLEQLKQKKLAPEFLTLEGYITLKNGYLLANETPFDMYSRVSKSVSSYLKKPELEDKFFKYLWNNWICLSTPVASNSGSDRGLVISCLTGDMMINTPSGVKEMSELCVGDEVLTHKGRYRKVVSKFSRKSSGDLYELVVACRPTRIKITGNHPVKTNLGWVRVDELNPDIHLIATNYNVEMPEERHRIHTLATKELLMQAKRLDNKNRNIGKMSEVKTNVEVDEDLAWALGLWFAEGSITTDTKGRPNAIRITMSSKEDEQVDRWISIICEKFGVNGGKYESTVIRNGKENKWISAYISSTVLASWFTNEFGRGCKEKKCPEWISRLSIKKSRAFLDGFIEGDGSHKLNNDKAYIVLANPYIIGTLYNICLKLGLPVSVDFTHKKSDSGKNSKYWHYSLTILNSYSLSQMKKFQTKKSRSAILFEDGLSYSPIRSLRKLAKDEEVFDITVEEDHSFSVAGVVVHNCFGGCPADNLYSIFNSFTETAMLSKGGGGTSKYWGNLRPRGEAITNNGISDGVVPWLKVEESTLQSVSQGGVRRGSGAQYLDIESPDIEEFIDIRRPTGDISRRCLSTNFHHGVCISDEFMNDCKAGDPKARSIWSKLLSARIETGEPYIFFKDTVNKTAPNCIKDRNLKILASNLCTEIFLPSNSEHTFVCCLSSLNLAKWEEWKDTDLVETAVYFLDGVMEEFIQKAEGKPGFENAVRFAKKSRALGLGVLGWHTLLQSKGIPFESFEAMTLNNSIFKHIREKADKATYSLAQEYGEVEWTKGYNRRNITCLAVAPTVSNSLISGGVSQGIEPIIANYYAQKSAKGTFVRKNSHLERLLIEKKENTSDVWDQINSDGGSVRRLNFLSEREKSIYATAREINQFAIIRQAAQRQQYIDQGQSVNLFFSASEDLSDEMRKKLGKYIHAVHIEAFDLSLKSLYYCRPSAVLKGDATISNSSDCKSCEG